MMKIVVSHFSSLSRASHYGDNCKCFVTVRFWHTIVVIRLCSCCLVKTLPDTKLLLSSMCWLWLACCLLGQVPRIRKYHISTFIKFTFNTIIQTNDFKAEYCITNKVNLVKIMHSWIVTEQYYKPIIGWIRRTLFCIDTAISWSNR